MTVLLRIWKRCWIVSNGQPNSEVQHTIVIRNLPEGENENTGQKVNGLLRDGMKLRNVAVETAERKKSYRRDTPGLVIAKLKSREDYGLVMKHKAKLKDSRNFSQVMVGPDRPKQERQQESNLKSIVNAVAKDKLMVKNGRVVPITEGNPSRQQERSQPHKNSRGYQERNKTQERNRSQQERSQFVPPGQDDDQWPDLRNDQSQRQGQRSAASSQNPQQNSMSTHL